MALPANPFSAPNFFESVRPLMDANRGLFGGNDGNLQYVVMDAVLYRLEIFRRPPTQSFTAAGTSLDADVRVLVNGQIFGRSKTDYCFLGPCEVRWQGEVIDAGVVSSGDPASMPAHRFFGRENAIPVWRTHVGRGDPSGVSGPALQFAMGGLIPLIEGRVRFGSGDLGAPPRPTQRHSNATAQWLRYPAKKGKTAVGLHRDSGCLFVVCQEDDAAPGLDIHTLISRLQAMDVDDAVLCDGSDSAALIVDRVVHAQPASYKDNSIPSGLMFRLNSLPFGSNGTFQVQNATTDATFLSVFPVGSTLTGITGTITARGAGGLELSLRSLGVGSPLLTEQQVADLMEVGPLPIRLFAPSTDLTTGGDFAGAGSAALVRLPLGVAHTPGQFDRLAGMLRITNDRGTILGAVTVPI